MKARALFVDDEPLVLNGLRRMLRSLRHDWEMSFANSGQEGLALLENQNFDVVVSDMRMPEMDGATFLGHVAEGWPSVARLVLSGHAELDAILRAVRPAHQFLAKPCDPKLLETALQRISHLRLNHCQTDICQKFGAHRRLPSPKGAIEQLREALHQTPPDIGLAAKIVKGDIAMSVQALRLVNSAFFGPPTKTFAPERAVTILGSDLMKSLVDDVHLFRPVHDTVDGGEAAVIEVNERSRAIRVVDTDISPDVLSMLSLTGTLAAIESGDVLNDETARTFSHVLLAFWGLDADIDRVPVLESATRSDHRENSEACGQKALAALGADLP